MSICKRPLSSRKMSSWKDLKLKKVMLTQLRLRRN